MATNEISASENHISKKSLALLHKITSPGQIAQAMQAATDMAYAMRDQRIAEAKLQCAKRKEKRAKHQQQYDAKKEKP